MKDNIVGVVCWRCRTKHVSKYTQPPNEERGGRHVNMFFYIHSWRKFRCFVSVLDRRLRPSNPLSFCCEDTHSCEPVKCRWVCDPPPGTQKSQQQTTTDAIESKLHELRRSFMLIYLWMTHVTKIFWNYKEHNDTIKSSDGEDRSDTNEWRFKKNYSTRVIQLPVSTKSSTGTTMRWIPIRAELWQKRFPFPA